MILMHEEIYYKNFNFDSWLLGEKFFTLRAVKLENQKKLKITCIIFGFTYLKNNEVGPQLSYDMVGPGFLNLALSENYRQKCFFAFNPKSIFRNDDRKERVDAER